MSIRIDASDFDKLAANLDAAARGDLLEQIGQSVSKGALETKKRWNNAIASTKWFHGASGTVTYDTRKRAESVQAEIGPVTAGKVVADLVTVAHFGTPMGGGGLPDPMTFLEPEGPELERYTGAIIDDLLGRL